MVKRRSKKKGPVQAKKISYDGINFASGLERYTYMALKKNKLFEILKSFDYCKFMMSNSNVDFVLQKFINYNITTLSARRAINSKNPGSKTTEVIICNY